MARPKEFDRDAAVERAMHVFWSKGYAATSTEDLLKAMRIGRQSMYDTFGGKRRLYLEALERYMRESVAGHVDRLKSTVSPLAGIESMVTGLIRADKGKREKGCMGVQAVCEFGSTDADLQRLRGKCGTVQHGALVERLKAAQVAGEIGKSANIEVAARFVEMTMVGLQVAARAGASVEDLRAAAAFAIAGLSRR